MSDLVLKLKNANGDLQRVTSDDEKHLAYQAGIQLKNSAGTSVGDLTTSPANGALGVGTFSNTFYNEAVGTHPCLCSFYWYYHNYIVSKTGYCYENSTEDSGRKHFQKPIKYDTVDSKLGIHPLTDAQLNTLCDRLNGRIAGDDYIGSYRLGSSAPSGDYTEKFTAFTDTRTDGTSTDYKIYQRTSMTAPTAIDVGYILDSDGYQGYQHDDYSTDAIHVWTEM